MHIGRSPSSSSNVCLLDGNIGGASRTRRANSVSGGTEGPFWRISETRVASDGSDRKGFGSTMRLVKFFMLSSSEGRKRSLFKAMFRSMRFSNFPTSGGRYVMQLFPMSNRSSHGRWTRKRHVLNDRILKSCKVNSAGGNFVILLLPRYRSICSLDAPERTWLLDAFFWRIALEPHSIPEDAGAV